MLPYLSCFWGLILVLGVVAHSGAQEIPQAGEVAPVAELSDASTADTPTAEPGTPETTSPAEPAPAVAEPTAPAAPAETIGPNPAEPISAEPMPAAGTSAESGLPGPQTTVTPPRFPLSSPFPISSANGVVEAGPEVFHLQDRNGRMVAIPGFRYEDFLKYYRLMHQLERNEVHSRYSIQHLAIYGKASDTQANLTVTLKIVVHDSHWVRVPLRLGQLVLREPPKHHGPGEASVELSSDEAGYTAWIRATPESIHTITLETVTPLGIASGDTRLQLTVPRSTSSQLQFVIGTEQLTVSGQGMTPPVLERGSDDGTTLVSAIGLTGSVTLNWRETKIQSLSTPVLLVANSKILSTLDGRSTQSEATITVSSTGASFQQLQLKLPPEAQLISGQQSGYQVTPSGTPGVVDVALESPTVGPIDLRLITEQPYDVTRSNQLVELAGFEVIGAVRQWRQIAIAVVGDWKIVWGDQTGARQINQWAEPSQTKDILAAYELVGSSSSLKVGVIPKIAKTHVEPEYLCRIESQEVQLDAKFKYQIRGGKVFTLTIDVQDWEIEEVTPASVVGRNWIVEGTILTLPLVQNSSEELEIHIKGKRPLKSPSDTLTLALPRPRADVVTPANLSILPADNIHLEPIVEEMVGLNRQTSSNSISTALANGHRPAFTYWVDQDQAVFAARYQVLEQQIGVRVKNEVFLVPQQQTIAQQLSFHVAHEPLPSLDLQVSRSVLTNGTFDIALDGQTIQPEPMGTGLFDQNEDMVTLRINFLRPRIGNFELGISYELPVATLVPESTSVISVPLAMPAQGAIVSNEAIVHSASSIRITNRSTSTWKSTTSSAVDNKQGNQLRLTASSTEPTSEVLISAALVPEDQLRSTVVEKAFVQTWLSNEVRQDRASYRLSTSATNITLKLPQGVDISSLEVLVNQSRFDDFSEKDRLLQINLPEAVRRDCLLELRYFVPGQNMLRSDFGFELPAFEGQLWAQQMYWQLILPRSEHLIVNPEQMTTEHRWQWSGFHWGRVPTLAPEELESWIGLNSTGFVPEGTNRYLFSAIGNIQHVRLGTMNRSFIVLLASFAALILGLAMIYLPAARHPALLFTAAIVLLGLCFVYPGPVLLIVQGASLGVALALVSLLLRQFSRKRARPFQVQAPNQPSSIISRVTTEYYRTAVSSPSSTSTAAAIIDIEAAGAKR